MLKLKLNVSFTAAGSKFKNFKRPKSLRNCLFFNEKSNAKLKLHVSCTTETLNSKILKDLKV
jgi:hypothetical protein